VITWKAGPGECRGDPWDDLWEDQPWRDPCHEADLAQDAAEAAARLAKIAAELGTSTAYAGARLERFGDPAELAAEATAGPVRPIPAGLPPRRLAADPDSLVDRPLVCAERRRRLNEALTDDHPAPAKGAA
jgi:hypothetical protein